MLFRSTSCCFAHFALWVVRHRQTNTRMQAKQQDVHSARRPNCSGSQKSYSPTCTNPTIQFNLNGQSTGKWTDPDRRPKRRTRRTQTRPLATYLRAQAENNATRDEEQHAQTNELCVNKNMDQTRHCQQAQKHAQPSAQRMRRLKITGSRARGEVQSNTNSKHTRTARILSIEDYKRKSAKRPRNSNGSQRERTEALRHEKPVDSRRGANSTKTNTIKCESRMLKHQLIVQHCNSPVGTMSTRTVNQCVALLSDLGGGCARTTNKSTNNKT